MSLPREPVFGNHLGIVINNEDPEFRGRVQVWIPYLSNTLHANWNKDLTNKSFKHIHDSGGLTPELVEELKAVLPWAECASPIFGGGTSATYNPDTGITDTYAGRTFGVENRFDYNGPLGTPNFAPGISADGLDPDVQQKLAAFAGAFPNAVITSTKRTGGSNPRSLHLTGRAIDVRVWDLIDGKRVTKPESEIRAMVEWWATVGGATEIGYEVYKPGQPHLHFGFNPSGRLNPFEIGSTPAWWKDFKTAFRSGKVNQVTQPHESMAGTEQNPFNTATGADQKIRDVSISIDPTQAQQSNETPLDELPSPLETEDLSARADGAQTAPDPYLGSSTIDSSYAGDQPSGMVSVPFPGAKVFIFFLAGDIQKPIYFANSLEPETMQKMIQTGSNPKFGIRTRKNSATGQTEGYSHQGTVTQVGPVKTSYNYIVNKQSDGTIVDDSNFEMSVGGVGIAGKGNVLRDDARDRRSSARGNRYDNTGGRHSTKDSGKIQSSDGDVTIIVGSQGSKEREAAEKLKKITKEVQKEKIEKIKSTAKSGEKVPCPLCSTSYSVDRASRFAKTAFKLIRNLLPPYFSYAIDVFQFLLGLILVPFTSIVPGHVLGECENPDCENGQIPSPQKPIENANREAVEKLSSKKEEIFEAEQKLGNGGSFSVAASKDVVISAGMVINDADCYAETVHKSNAVKLITVGKKGNGSTTTSRMGSGKIKNVVYTPPTNLPGNLMLRGGNSVKIVAGSAGIELDTKGPLKLNCGSIELLSSDGEMVFGSKNHTTLKGKVVTIDADTREEGCGVEIRSPNMICKGFSASGNANIKGGLRLDGELSIPFLNAVGQRTQTDQGASPDQRIPFSNWAIGPAQTNDILNTIRTALTHYLMPGALLNLTNIIKLVMQTYNTILINTVIEPLPTGLYLGFCCNAAGPGISWGYIWNWHHNMMEDPKPHHHDYTQPKGNYYDDVQGVRDSAVEAGPIPTEPRKNGAGPDGGPKTLAGCGGFGGWGGGSGGRRFNLTPDSNLKIPPYVPNFTNTRLQSSNIKFKRDPNGNIDIIIDNTNC